MSVNRLYPIWIKNENTIPATYGNVSLYSQAKTDLNKVTTTGLGINKDAPTLPLALDVSGNTFLRGRTDISGNLYINNVEVGTGIPIDISNNFVWNTSNRNQSINGNKTFTNDLISNRGIATNELIGVNSGLNRQATSLRNTAIGDESFRGSSATPANNTGTDCVGIGYQALQNSQAGNKNTAIGSGALLSYTRPNTFATDADGHMTAIGYNTLRANVEQRYITAIGSRCMESYNDFSGFGHNITCIGANALRSATRGAGGSTLIGYGILETTGVASTSATICGAGAFGSATTSFESCGFGAASGSTNAGSFNTYLGFNAGQYNSTGNCNVYIGQRAGHNTSLRTNYSCVVVIGGSNAMANSSGRFVLGGRGQVSAGPTDPADGLYPAVCIPNKVLLQSCETLPTQASITMRRCLTIDDGAEYAENILIPNTTITSITLPITYSYIGTGANNSNANAKPASIGMTYHFIKTYEGALTSVTINAPTGQTILVEGQTTAQTSFNFDSNMRVCSITCINFFTGSPYGNGIYWVVRSRDYNNYQTTNTTQTINALKTFTAGITASASQTIDFGTNAPTMSGANISSASIPDTALSSNVALLNTAQTFSALKTFSSGLTLSSGTLTLPSSSVADSALSSNVALLNTAQTFSALQTFSGGLTLSSGTLTLPSASVADSALSSNVALLNTAQTFSALKTFSSGLTLSSGTLTLPSASVADSALSSNVALLNTAQTFSALKTFSSGLTLSSGTLTLPSSSVADSALSSNVMLKNTTNEITGTIRLTSDGSKQFVVQNTGATLQTSIAYQGIRTDGYFECQAVNGDFLKGLKTGSVAFTITSDELAQLDGISTSSTIQTQLNGCVKTTGDQTIAGTKTFSNSIVCSSTILGTTGIRMSGGSLQTSGGLYFTTANLRRKVVLCSDPNGTNNDFNQYSIGTIDNTISDGKIIYNVPSNSQAHLFTYGFSTTSTKPLLELRSGNSTCYSQALNFNDGTDNIVTISTASGQTGGVFVNKGASILMSDTVDRLKIEPAINEININTFEVYLNFCDLYIKNNSGVVNAKINDTAIDLSGCEMIVEQMKLSKSNTTSITGATTITKPYNQYYSVDVTGTAFTITLPTITAKDVGHEIVFRKVRQINTAVSISFIGNGTQLVYNTALTGGATAQALMPNNTYLVRLVALHDAVNGTGVYAWFQI